MQNQARKEDTGFRPEDWRDNTGKAEGQRELPTYLLAEWQLEQTLVWFGIIL